MSEIKNGSSDIERIKALYESGEGLHDPGQMYAHMLIVLAELDRTAGYDTLIEDAERFRSLARSMKDERDRLRATPTGPWRAVLHDDHGWIHDDPDEALRQIFADDEGGRITVCRGSRLPSGDDERMSGTYTSSDIFVEIDLSDVDDEAEGFDAWRRAQAAADGLNRLAAAASSTPETVEATNHG